MTLNCLRCGYKKYAPLQSVRIGDLLKAIFGGVNLIRYGHNEVDQHADNLEPGTYRHDL